MIQLVTPYDIKLVYVQKLHLFLGKSTKTILPPELHFLTPICTKSFVAPDSTAYGAAYSAPPYALHIAVFMRLQGGEGREFVLCPRNKKEKSAPISAIAECGFQEMEHPPHSPVLAPCDYVRFRHFNKHLCGRRFQVILTFKQL